MATIFDRMSTILRANINSMLDKAENPEVVIDQILRDMASARAEARGQVAEMIAQEKTLQLNVQRNRDLSKEWQDKAELAVQRSRDDLAREALRRKTDFDETARVYDSQLQSQSQMVDKLKSELQQLESKYEDAKRNREILIARHRRAESQQKVAQVSAQMDTMDPSAELGRMEERIRLSEARAEAQAEMATTSFDDEFDALAGDSEVESQLQALKLQLGSGEQVALPSGEESTATGERTTEA